MRRMMRGVDASASVIVYCVTKRDTEAVAGALVGMNFKAAAYHAGMTHMRRTQIHSDVRDSPTTPCVFAASGRCSVRVELVQVLGIRVPPLTVACAAGVGQFLRDKIQVVAATVAFGMGIDKPDIRLVVHYGVPKTVEDYYQHTGRAGRDGAPSRCECLYNGKDFATQQYLIKVRGNTARHRACSLLRV